MAESPDPDLGRPPKQELADEIKALLKSKEKRAWTLGEIVDDVNGSRKTVQKRLNDLTKENTVRHEKIGNATAYWIEEDEETASRPPLIGLVPAGVVDWDLQIESNPWLAHVLMGVAIAAPLTYFLVNFGPVDSRLDLIAVMLTVILAGVAETLRQLHRDSQAAKPEVSEQ